MEKVRRDQQEKAQKESDAAKEKRKAKAAQRLKELSAATPKNGGRKLGSRGGTTSPSKDDTRKSSYNPLILSSGIGSSYR